MRIIERALRGVKNRLKYEYLSNESIENYNAVVESLERQIPKISGCYLCDDTSNSRYFNNEKYNYCPYCGQKLKWD